MKDYTYEIFDDGYNIIIIDGKKREVMPQHGILSKQYNYAGTYEDNAKVQIAEMQANDQTQQTAEDEYKKMRADVDFLLLASDSEVAL